MFLKNSQILHTIQFYFYNIPKITTEMENLSCWLPEVMDGGGNGRKMGEAT